MKLLARLPSQAAFTEDPILDYRTLIMSAFLSATMGWPWDKTVLPIDEPAAMSPVDILVVVSLFSGFMWMPYLMAIIYCAPLTPCAVSPRCCRLTPAYYARRQLEGGQVLHGRHVLEARLRAPAREAAGLGGTGASRPQQRAGELGETLKLEPHLVRAPHAPPSAWPSLSAHRVARAPQALFTGAIFVANLKALPDEAIIIPCYIYLAGRVGHFVFTLLPPIFMMKTAAWMVSHMANMYIFYKCL